MRVTTRTNLAMRVLMYCAANNSRLVTRDEIAQAVNASTHHTGHVVGQLAQVGAITTVRGRSGGLRLAAPMADINIGQVFRHLESHLPIAECFDMDTNNCPLAGACKLRDALAAAAEAFYASLDQVALSDIMSCNVPLLDMLQCDGPRIACSVPAE